MGKRALRDPAAAAVCVRATLSHVSSKGMFCAPGCRATSRWSPGCQVHGPLFCVSPLLRLNKWKEITLKKRRPR